MLCIPATHVHTPAPPRRVASHTYQYWVSESDGHSFYSLICLPFAPFAPSASFSGESGSRIGCVCGRCSFLARPPFGAPFRRYRGEQLTEPLDRSRSRAAAVTPAPCGPIIPPLAPIGDCVPSRAPVPVPVCRADAGGRTPPFLGCIPWGGPPRLLPPPPASSDGNEEHVILISPCSGFASNSIV